MKYVTSSNINGIIDAPVSKSVLQRILICDFLCGSNLLNYNIDNFPDDAITVHNAFLDFTMGKEKTDLRDSGFCLRVFPILFAKYSENNIFKISDGLAKRPIINLLGEIGLEGNLKKINNYSSELSVKGKISSGVFHIDGSATSQLLTGMLITLPTFQGNSIIHVSNLKSKGYIDLTIEILKKYSIEVFHTNYEIFHINGSQTYKNVDNFLEADWSGAAFLISAAAISAVNGLKIRGINLKSSQPDKKILEILDLSGVKYALGDDYIYIEKSKVRAFNYDFSECPDLLPAIIPLTINSDDNCILLGIEKLKIKESNRVAALISEYNKCGIIINDLGDSIQVIPGSFCGTKVDSHNDHRIVMSLAVSALNGENKLIIEDDTCVRKSYPNFWGDLKKIGANIYE